MDKDRHNLLPSSYSMGSTSPTQFETPQTVGIFLHGGSGGAIADRQLHAGFLTVHLYIYIFNSIWFYLHLFAIFSIPNLGDTHDIPWPSVLMCIVYFWIFLNGFENVLNRFEISFSYFLMLNPRNHRKIRANEKVETTNWKFPIVPTYPLPRQKFEVDDYYYFPFLPSGLWQRLTEIPQPLPTGYSNLQCRSNSIKLKNDPPSNSGVTSLKKDPNSKIKSLHPTILLTSTNSLTHDLCL